MTPSSAPAPPPPVPSTSARVRMNTPLPMLSDRWQQGQGGAPPHPDDVETYFLATNALMYSSSHHHHQAEGGGEGGESSISKKISTENKKKRGEEAITTQGVEVGIHYYDLTKGLVSRYGRHMLARDAVRTGDSTSGDDEEPEEAWRGVLLRRREGQEQQRRRWRAQQRREGRRTKDDDKRIRKDDAAEAQSINQEDQEQTLSSSSQPQREDCHDEGASSDNDDNDNDNDDHQPSPPPLSQPSPPAMIHHRYSILHSALVAYGFEYFFEGGIARARQGRSRFGLSDGGGDQFTTDCYCRYVKLGVSRKTKEQFEQWLRHVEPIKYDLSMYRATSYNCHVFVKEAIEYLLYDDDDSDDDKDCEKEDKSNVNLSVQKKVKKELNASVNNSQPKSPIDRIAFLFRNTQRLTMAPMVKLFLPLNTRLNNGALYRVSLPLVEHEREREMCVRRLGVVMRLTGVRNLPQRMLFLCGAGADDGVQFSVLPPSPPSLAAASDHPAPPDTNIQQNNSKNNAPSSFASAASAHRYAVVSGRATFGIEVPVLSLIAAIPSQSASERRTKQQSLSSPIPCCSHRHACHNGGDGDDKEEEEEDGDGYHPSARELQTLLEVARRIAIDGDEELMDVTTIRTRKRKTHDDNTIMKWDDHTVAANDCGETKGAGEKEDERECAALRDQWEDEVAANNYATPPSTAASAIDTITKLLLFTRSSGGDGDEDKPSSCACCCRHSRHCGVGGENLLRQRQGKQQQQQEGSSLDRLASASLLVHNPLTNTLMLRHLPPRHPFNRNCGKQANKGKPSSALSSFSSAAAGTVVDHALDVLRLLLLHKTLCGLAVYEKGLTMAMVCVGTQYFYESKKRRGEEEAERAAWQADACGEGENANSKTAPPAVSALPSSSAPPPTMSRAAKKAYLMALCNYCSCAQGASWLVDARRIGYWITVGATALLMGEDDDDDDDDDADDDACEVDDNEDEGGGEGHDSDDEEDTYLTIKGDYFVETSTSTMISTTVTTTVTDPLTGESSTKAICTETREEEEKGTAAAGDHHLDPQRFHPQLHPQQQEKGQRKQDFIKKMQQRPPAELQSLGASLLHNLAVLLVTFYRGTLSKDIANEPSSHPAARLITIFLYTLHDPTVPNQIVLKIALALVHLCAMGDGVALCVAEHEFAIDIDAMIKQRCGVGAAGSGKSSSRSTSPFVDPSKDELQSLLCVLSGFLVMAENGGDKMFGVKDDKTAFDPFKPRQKHFEEKTTTTAATGNDTTITTTTTTATTVAAAAAEASEEAVKKSGGVVASASHRERFALEANAEKASRGSGGMAPDDACNHNEPF